MRLSIILALALSGMGYSAGAQINIGLPSVSIGVNLGGYPDMTEVPGYPVYYAPRLGYNLFFYDGLYWVYSRDGWYSSSWYDGPWDAVEPAYVPLFVLRVPVRYYRDPPAYFGGWSRDNSPRWGEHWGHDWERQHSGWDQWDRHNAPRAAPLPTYQRQYSGNRYPDPQQQRTLREQNYHYQSRDSAVSRQVEQMHARQPDQAPQQRAQQERTAQERAQQERTARAEQRTQPEQQRAQSQQRAQQEHTAQAEQRAQQEQRAQSQQRAQQEHTAQADQRAQQEQRAQSQQRAQQEHKAQADQRAQQEQRSQSQQRAQQEHTAQAEPRAQQEQQRAQSQQRAQQEHKAQADQRAQEQQRAQSQQRAQQEHKAQADQRAQQDQRAQSQQRAQQEQRPQQEPRE
jgi:hypothetical protein